MKRVKTSPIRAEIDLDRSVLESANIPCEIRNEAVSQLFGVPFMAELWVLDDADHEEATRLLTPNTSTAPEAPVA